MYHYRLIQDENDHTIRNKNHIIQDIFKDWWETFLEKFPVRDVCKHEIHKFLLCGSKSFRLFCL